MLALCASTADARWTLYGKASVYANDAAYGWVDHGDNNIPALAGASNENPGIAVYNSATLGSWWRVCWLLRPASTGCRWVMQSDFGPAGWTGRLIDINAVAARELWGIPAWRFPTDVGTWKAVHHGPRLTRSQLRQTRFERCNTRRCMRAHRPTTRRRARAHG